MELWVRSQDREDLVKVENIRCWNETQIVVNVKTSFNNVDYVVVGEYETKERALEVLDEIQEYITPTLSLLDDTLNGKQICQVGNILSMVYEMPKD